MRTENRLQLLGQVASLYYEQGKSQAEIAQKLGYSRSAISRLITEAHKKGIVEVTVNHPIQRSYYHEQKLKQVFNLQEAYVLMESNDECDSRIRLLGQLGAQVLMENLPEDGLLGITWGYAVYEVVQAIKPRHLPKVKVVQMMGALGKGDPKLDGPGLAHQLAIVLSGRHYIPHVPLMVESDETYRALLKQQNIREVMEMMNHLDVAVIGIGSGDPDLSGVRRAGYLTHEEIEEIKKLGAVGDVCGYYIDIHGDILDIEFNNHLIAADMRKLRQTPCQVIGIAGCAPKVPSIFGALRGEYFDILVTDEEAAEGVLRMAMKYLD